MSLFFSLVSLILSVTAVLWAVAIGESNRRRIENLEDWQIIHERENEPSVTLGEVMQTIEKEGDQ